MKRLFAILNPLFLTAFLMWSVVSFANEYQLAAASTGWDEVDFTVAPSGFYEYYEANVSPEFWFNLSSKTSGEISSIDYAPQTGYCGTDLTVSCEEGNEMYFIDPAPTHYYIIIWYPNTSFNSNNDPVFCASTALPSSQYYYRGDDNSWGADAMTISVGGYYEV